jgi:hypothetical protein
MRGSAVFRTGVAPGGVLAGPWVKNELWRRARAVPSLDLRFADNKSLTDAVTGQSLVTFTRASSGTYVGSDGVLRTSTTNEPRFDHNPTTGESLGLLVEETRTNNLLQSQNFSATWTVNAATVGTAIAAPDGTTTAQKIEENSTTDQHRVTQTSAGGATTSAVCLSVFAKAAERTKIRVAFTTLSFWTGGGGAAVIFDLAAGTAATDSSTPTAFGITPYPNGWYRCFIVGTPISSITPVANVFLYTTTTSYAGTTGNGVYLWGAQLEAGAFPTSYIPTTTATVTRSADVASITGTNFSSWYRQDEGTVFAHITKTSNNIGGVFDICGATAANSIRLTPSDATHFYRVNTSTTEFVAFNISASANNARSAFTFKADDISASVNAQNPSTDASAAIPSVSQMLIGDSLASVELNGTIRRLVYWGQRLPNSTLQSITI